MTMTLTLKSNELFFSFIEKELNEKKGKIEYIKEKNRLLIGVLDKKLSGFKILFTFWCSVIDGHFVHFVMHAEISAVVNTRGPRLGN